MKKTIFKELSKVESIWINLVVEMKLDKYDE